MMVKLIILICILLQVTYAQFTCKPQVDCIAFGVDSLVPDPQDCEKYYICVDSAAGSVPSNTTAICPSGNYFSNTGYCVAGTCNFYCQITIINQCPTACPTPPTSALVIYPGSCTNFYSCDPSGEVFDGNCNEPNPYFDGNTCVKDPNYCCNICMPPYCKSKGLHIPDPYSCTNFYICNAVGQPDKTSHYRCIDGQYFDTPTGKCVDGTTCQSFCSDEIITTSTTPSTTILPSTSSSTTTSSCITSGCPDTFLCPYNGDFPRCSSCDRSYFHCSGGTATIWCCNEGQVFNTKDGYPYCIDASLCPYF